MRIAHISDIHIRNLKYHDEYRRVFDDLYTRLYALKPDVIINTGDTAHTKTQISPEFVQMTSEFFQALAAIAPLEVILGNHDLNLMNPDRQDAITPIVDSLAHEKIHLHKKSGLAFEHTWSGDGNFKFWAFSMADPKNYPGPDSYDDKDINVGLFHGSVAGCVTDLNWRMTNVEHQLNIFDGLDYALLGDIHKQQFFKDRRIAYAGSLIQQNFGEEIEKGFLLWDITGKDDFKVQSIMLKGSRKFYTVRLNPDLSLPFMDVEEGSRVRISPPVPITLAQQKQIERDVRRIYKPHDVITLSPTDIGLQRALVKDGSESVENLRKLEVQEKLIREFLEEKQLSADIMHRVLELNRKYQIHIEQEDDTPRNIKWKIDRIAWSNFFNYGEENYIEFAELPGLTGIFGPNGSGKSALIDTILETCFDSITKNVKKNLMLINDNKERAGSSVHLSVNDQRYVIERELQRVKYGQKKFDETKEWGRTDVTFAMVDDDGGLDPLTGQSRPETERNIRQRLGTYEDFLLTSVSAQANPLDIISCKETKRKEILFKFFDLDIFQEKGDLAKKESREHFEKLKRLEDEGLEKIIVTFRNKTFDQQDQLRTREQDLEIIEDERDEALQEIAKLRANRPQLKQVSKSDWTTKIDKADKDIDEQKRRHTAAKEIREVLDSEIKKLVKLEEKFDLLSYEKKEDWAEELKARVDGKQEALRKLDAESTALIANSEEIYCPECSARFKSVEGSPKMDDVLHQRNHVMLEISRLQKELESLVPDLVRLREYREFIGERDSKVGKRDNFLLQEENFQLKVSSLESQRHKWMEERAAWERSEKDIKLAEEIDGKIRIAEFEKSKLEKSIDAVQKDIADLNRDLGSSEGILEKLTHQMDELQEIRDTCQAFELFQDAMGKDGIPLKILVQKLPVLNEQINKILANAAEFGVTVDYDPEEQSVNFFMQYGQYKSRILELAGGAEKFLASIAIRAGLLSMSNLPKTNLFIVDEGFGKLDPKSLENVQRMFEYLRTVFDHVLVISHVDSMKDIVDNIIEITSDQEGYAHVAIGGADAD